MKHVIEKVYIYGDKRPGEEKEDKMHFRPPEFEDGCGLRMIFLIA